MEELNEKIEQLQAMLEANISKMNKIVLEESQKTLKEAQILNDSTKRLNSSLDEFTSKLGQMDSVLRNFKPSVEVKQYNIDVTKPLTWVLTASGVILICFVISFVSLSRKDHFKAQSAEKTANYIKYKYMKLFGDRELQKTLKLMDEEYAKSSQEIGNEVLQRENELYNAKNAEIEARKQATEAARLQHYSDSLKNIKR